MTGAETDGEKPVTITTSDEAGNGAEDTSQSLVFDFTPPALTGAPTVTPALAAAATTVQIAYTFTEPLAAAQERGPEEGCLVWAARDEPYPVGYYCGLRDPDGNFVEFSYGQPLGPGAEQADAEALPQR